MKIPTSLHYRQNRTKKDETISLEKGLQTNQTTPYMELFISLNQLILTSNKWEDTLQEILEIIEAGHCQFGRFLRM